MAGVITLLLAECAESSEAALQQLVGAATADTGGSIASPPALAGDEGRRVVAASFPLAIDATQAALQIVHTVAPTDPTVRAVLCTDPAPDVPDEPDAPDAPDTPDRPDGGVELARAMRLLRRRDPGQILVNATTAVLVGPLLPSGVELVEAGDPSSRSAGTMRSERVYQLRLADTGTATDADGPGERSHPDQAASNLAWARRAAAGPILGREEPAAALDTAWHDTLRGVRRQVVLTGESGIGKTALAAEFALQTHAHGALVLYGRWDREQISPYQAIREALGSYAAACPTEQLREHFATHRDAISRLLPDVAARLGDRHPPRSSSDPEGERLSLYDAVQDWLDVLAARRPVLVVLDDLQWAERSSVLLVDHLQQTTGPAPWMLLCTRRDPPIAGADTAQHIELQGLDTAAVAELAGQVLDARLQADDEAIGWLTTETAGNPLFVHYILRSVPPTAATDAPLQAVRDRLPDQLRDVVHWRLTQLPGSTRQLLAAAAAIGPVVDVDLIASATDQPHVHLRGILEPALEQELLRPDPADDGQYHFTHEVVRRTLDQDIQADHARRLHRRVAGALAARAAQGRPVAPAEIAHHHLRGADRETADAAIFWARRAAEAARLATGFDEAVQLLERAVAVDDEVGRLSGDRVDDTQACALRLELAQAQDLAGQFTARDQRYLEAAALARELERNDLFTQAVLGCGGRLPAAPLPNPTARDLLTDALDRLARDDDHRRALVLGRLAHLQHFDAPYRVRLELSDQAEAAARKVDDPSLLATTLAARCFALEGPDSIDDRRSAGDEIERIGQEIDNPDIRLQGIRLQVPALLAAGRHDEARALATVHARLAQEIRHVDHLRLATMWEILWTGLEGDGVAAEAMVDELVRQLTEAGHTQAPFISFAYAFVPRWLHGRLELTRPILDQLRTALPTWTGFWALSVWLDAGTGNLHRARASLDERDPGTTIERIERDFLWWSSMVSLAVGSSSCGHAAWAAAVHQALLPYAGRLGITGYALFVGAVDHHLGTLALTLDHPDEAVDRLESALTSHRSLGTPPFVALSACWLARARATRAASGDHDRASALLGEVAELVDRFDLGGLPKFPDEGARYA